MFNLDWQSLSKIIQHCTIPGLFAGIVLFLISYSKNHYKNNKYFVKLMIEIFGAAITATFIAQVIKEPAFRIITAFCIGLIWTKAIQLIRNKITRLVEVIFEHSYGEK